MIEGVLAAVTMADTIVEPTSVTQTWARKLCSAGLAGIYMKCGQTRLVDKENENDQQSQQKSGSS